MFYIYAFDGRLLAEYDISGLLVREYIYFGGKLVAEYRNQGSQLLYYASDQINSTRVVTDSTGTVVYAAAHEPYGGIQKTWVSTYDPSLKFSGKQRDAESDLDYFGARYYDRSLYRFLSIDPALTKTMTAFNPQMLNCYSFSRNNPISYIEAWGAYSVYYLVCLVTAPFGEFLEDSKGRAKLNLGETHATWGDIFPYVNDKGKDSLGFVILFKLTTQHPDNPGVTQQRYGDTLDHETHHIYDVMSYLEMSLALIEMKWRKDHDLEKARRSLGTVLLRAERHSKSLRDSWIDFGSHYEDPFQYWLREPSIYRDNAGVFWIDWAWLCYIFNI